MRLGRNLLLSGLLGLAGAGVSAAGEAPLLEVGGGLTAVLADDGSGETTAFEAVAGRIGLNLNDSLAVEGELGFFPSTDIRIVGSGDWHKLQGLFGLKAGKRLERVGVFGKLRLGFVESRATLVTFPPVDVSETDFALDLGVVVEAYFLPLVTLRVDVADLIIPSEERNSVPFDGHNLQLGVGIALGLW